eukprot:966658-Rhodomonas_salina.2
MSGASAWSPHRLRQYRTSRCERGGRYEEGCRGVELELHAVGRREVAVNRHHYLPLHPVPRQPDHVPRPPRRSVLVLVVWMPFLAPDSVDPP